MTVPASYMLIGCTPENIQPDNTCTTPVLLPYHQPVLPALSLEDGTIVAFSIVGCWGLGLVAGLIYKAAKQGHA